MVSRLVPTSCEISSWVMARRTRNPTAADLAIGGGVQQESGKSLRNRMRQADGAHHAIGIGTVARQMLGGTEAGGWVFVQEAKHIFAPHEVQLTGLHGFNRQLIGLAGNDSVRPRSSPASAMRTNQRFAVARSGGELGAPLTRTKTPHGFCPSTRTTACSETRRRVLFYRKSSIKSRGEVAEKTFLRRCNKTALDAVSSGPLWTLLRLLAAMVVRRRKRQKKL